MFLASVINILITVVVGTTFAGDETEVKHLDPEEGTAGYDLFYYDGESLRDEKWRFDPKSGSTVVSRRNGFRDKDNFHLVDATLDALGSFTKSYNMKNEPSFLNERVREPQMHKNGDNIGNEAVKMSNAYSGVSFNTQYSTQNGFPHVSNVVGIQQINAPNQYNGLNFQQAFSTSGFGVQQHGSLFNHQTQFPPSNPSVTFPNNQNFQLSSFITQFLNQHNNHNQHLPFGSFPSFGTIVTEMGHEHATEKPAATSTIQNTPQSTTEPVVKEQTTATTTTTTTTTTPDPTLNFDVRLEKDEKESANETDTGNIQTTSQLDEFRNDSTNETEPGSIQTTSRRTIEGLPSSDEDYSEVGGVLDEKIGPKVLLSSVG